MLTLTLNPNPKP